MNEKIIFSMFVIGVVASRQGVACYIGCNSTVFAFTSLIIGTIAGSVLGFSFKSLIKQKE